jgi:hypothetical protein
VTVVRLLPHHMILRADVCMGTYQPVDKFVIDPNKAATIAYGHCCVHMTRIHLNRLQQFLHYTLTSAIKQSMLRSRTILFLNKNYRSLTGASSGLHHTVAVEKNDRLSGTVVWVDVG